MIVENMKINKLLRCYIIDTLIGIYATDEGGNFLNYINFLSDIQKSVDFYNSLNSENLTEDYSSFLNELKNSGFDHFIYDNILIFNHKKSAPDSESGDTSARAAALGAARTV